MEINQCSNLLNAFKIFILLFEGMALNLVVVPAKRLHQLQVEVNICSVLNRSTDIDRRSSIADDVAEYHSCPVSTLENSDTSNNLKLKSFRA